MKKPHIFSLAVVMTMLTGCANEGEPISFGNTSTSVLNSSSSFDDTFEHVQSTDEEIIAGFDGELVLPDKTTFPNSDIVGITDDPLSKDIRAFLTENGIIAFAAPVFFDAAAPEYINYAPQEKETELGMKTQYTEPNRDYFVVHKGDKLDSGLTVESAQTGFYINDGNFSFTQVRFKGEITLSGVLMPYIHDLGEKGSFENKKFVFIPDSTQSSVIPTPYDPMAVCKTIDFDGKEIVYDGTEFYLTADEDISGKYSEISENEKYLENVSVTMKDIVLAYYYTIGYGVLSEGELVSIVSNR